VVSITEPSNPNGYLHSYDYRLVRWWIR